MSESKFHKELYNRTKGCNGKVVELWSGVKCDTCEGWFCY